MRKFIYLSIVEQLQTIRDENGEPQIKHFDLWNNNIENIETSEAFYLPAVFVEFGTIDWRHQSQGVREAAVKILLHVITENFAPTSHELNYETEALTFFDLLTDINRCLYGYHRNNDNFGHDALTSLQSITDHNFDELQHNIEVFVCHAVDASALPEYTRIQTPPLKINT